MHLRNALLSSLALLLVASSALAAVPTFDLEWGSQGTGNSQFDLPWGVAVDSNGDVYVADYQNHRIQKFDAAGGHVLTFGQLGTGDGDLIAPYDVAVDASDNVYVAESGNNRVSVFTSGGSFMYTFGSGGSGNGQFNTPMGITVDSSGDIYVADGLNHRVQKFASGGAYLLQFGSFGSDPGAFRIPVGLATDASDNLLVVDQGNHRVQKFSGAGAYMSGFGMFGTADGEFAYPQGITVTPNGSIFVVSLTQHHVQKFDSDGNFLEKWGVNGSGNGEFNYPADVEVAGNAVYVVDGRNYRVQKFTDPTPAPPVVPASILAQIDIEPGQWPNQLIGDGDLIDVALLGSPHFDPAQVDLGTIRMAGFRPLRLAISDASAAVGANGCHMSTIPFDGWDDLVVQFKRSDLLQALPNLDAGESDQLVFTGRLRDGTPFNATDCVQMGNHPATSGDDLSDMDIVPRNPIKRVHVVQFTLPEAQRVNITVLDVSGRVVDRLVNDWRGSGHHEFEWTPSRLPSGVYFVRMRTDDNQLVRRVSLHN